MSPQSGERTEKATQKKRRDEREKGNVLRSQDFATAVLLIGVFGVLKIFAPSMGTKIRQMITMTLPGVPESGGTLGIPAVMQYFTDVALVAVPIILPLFLFVLVGSALVHVLQTGFLLTSKPLQFKPDRISPINGFKRVFSSRMFFEMGKSLVKIAIVLGSVYQLFQGAISRIASLIRFDLATAASMVSDLLFTLAFRCAVILVVLSVVDYVYQWWKYEKDIKMTKQEVKDENKNSEGNPQNKGRIRQIQRSMAMQRMMQSVPEANVVITNPTHFAVALRYDPDRDTAPIVLAKGKDLIAKRIRTIAEEHKIANVENRPLARALYAQADVGQQIPTDLYAAVAEVLAYVTRMKEGRA